MSFRKDKQLYNYLVNTLQISKAMVMDVVNTRIEELLSKHLESKLNSNYIENLILNRVTQTVVNGIPKAGIAGMYYDRRSFDDYLKEVIRSVLLEKMNAEYELEVKVVHKDANIIGRARR